MDEPPNVPIPDPHVPQTEGLQIIDDHRLITLCGVVERPNHHCGDDLIDIVESSYSFIEFFVVMTK